MTCFHLGRPAGRRCRHAPGGHARSRECLHRRNQGRCCEEAGRIGAVGAHESEYPFRRMVYLIDFSKAQSIDICSGQAGDWVPRQFESRMLRRLRDSSLQG